MLAYIDTPIISFYVSLAGILGMLWFKAMEVRSGKTNWFLRVVNVMNHKVHDGYVWIVKQIRLINKRTAIALVEWIAYHILSWAREVYIWAHKRAHAHPSSKRVIDMVRGKGEVKKNGGVSFYLKSISEGEDVPPEVK